jgi:hypothetical protein
MGRGTRALFFSPATALGLGFVIGAGIVFFFVYLPSQRLLIERERAINEMARFNREEQERVRAMRDVSSGEMMKWVALADRTNTEFQNIQQRLHDQERNLQNPGWFYITLSLGAVVTVTVVYILAMRATNAKDVTTLENFETFISNKMRAFEERRIAAHQLPSGDATRKLQGTIVSHGKSQSPEE